MKRLLMAATAGILLAVAGCAQPPGSGHGMMDGEDAYEARAMGPEMMRGDGPQPAHGRRGRAMQPDMMGGGHGRGGAMMGGFVIPDLSDAQRTQMAQIQQEFGRKHWALMGQMHEQGGPPDDGLQRGQFDEQAARRHHEAMLGIQKQMFENSLEARKRIDGLLTPQQREQLRSRAAGR